MASSTLEPLGLALKAYDIITHAITIFLLIQFPHHIGDKTRFRSEVLHLRYTSADDGQHPTPDTRLSELTTLPCRTILWRTRGGERRRILSARIDWVCVKLTSPRRKTLIILWYTMMLTGQFMVCFILFVDCWRLGHMVTSSYPDSLLAFVAFVIFSLIVAGTVGVYHVTGMLLQIIWIRMLWGYTVLLPAADQHDFAQPKS